MTKPGTSHAVDPARRQVGESYKDYADRIYGMYRALLEEHSKCHTKEEK